MFRVEVEEEGEEFVPDPWKARYVDAHVTGEEIKVYGPEEALGVRGAWRTEDDIVAAIRGLAKAIGRHYVHP
jgi:hypothetical protein